MEINEIIEMSGMSMKKFAEHFEIPYRTVQDWKYGNRKAPEYVLKMILRLLEFERGEKNEIR